MNEVDTTNEKPQCGWGWPLLARKAHYFNGDIESLCGKWWYRGDLEDDNDDSPDNCKECRRRLAKLRAESESNDV